MTTTIECGQRMQEEITRLRAEVERLTRERDELREAIVTFCDKSNWADRRWKKQAWIAPLFKIRDRALLAKGGE